MNKYQKHFTAAILSGGYSRRMDGINKSLLKINKTSIITRTVNVLKNITSSIIIATNTPADYFQMFTGVDFIEDIIPDKGPLSGIHSVLKRSKNKDVFICASDMPFIEPRIITCMYSVFKTVSCKILVPAYNQFIEPLFAFYSSEILNKLEEYMLSEPNPAVHNFIETTDTYLYRVGKDQLKTFTNINTLEDFLRIRE